MGAMMVTIDRVGRVVIPKETRDRLSITADTELELTVLGDAIQLSPVRRAGRTVVDVDGFPRLEGVEGMPITDADVQTWRDADQR